MNNDQLLGLATTLMGVGLIVVSLRDGEAGIHALIRSFPRATHPKTYWTLMACYAAMAIGGAAYLVVSLK